MPKVFVARRIPDAGLELLYEAVGKENVVVAPQDAAISRDDLLAGVKGVDALLPILTDKVDAEVMDAAGPQLRIIANYAVGYNNIDVPTATERKIPVTNTPGVLTDTTADLTMALLLCAARRISESERFLRARKWDGWGPLQFLGTDIHGKTLGIFGMGRIGQTVAKRCGGFDMNIFYTNRNPVDEATEKKLGARFVDKATLLAESDYICVMCPFTPETRHSFGAAEFKAMKKSAYLINTSRGPVVDEAALVDALKSGEIHGAALDVFEEEPKVHPGLFELDNAVIIPHLGSATLETRSKMATIAAENIVARFQGKELPTCVNPEVLKG